MQRGELVDRVEHPVALDDLALGGEVQRRDLDVLGLRCRSRCRARSSSTAGRRGCSRPGRRGRCTGSRAPGAGSWGPTGRTRRGTRRRAPWRGPSPRRAGAPPNSASNLFCFGGLEQHRRLDPVARAVGLLVDEAALDRVRDRRDDQLQPELARPTVAVGEDLREVEAGVDVHDRERDPRRARRPSARGRSITVESLPPENSRHGRCISAATSRKM